MLYVAQPHSVRGHPKKIVGHRFCLERTANRSSRQRGSMQRGHGEADHDPADRDDAEDSARLFDGHFEFDSGIRSKISQRPQNDERNEEQEPHRQEVDQVGIRGQPSFDEISGGFPVVHRQQGGENGVDQGQAIAPHAFVPKHGNANDPDEKKDSGQHLCFTYLLLQHSG